MAGNKFPAVYGLINRVMPADTRTKEDKETDEKQMWINIVKTRISFAKSVNDVKKEIEYFKEEEEDE